MNYVDLVDIRMGTNSIPTFSRGNTVPSVSYPFGMASFALETRIQEVPFRLFYHPDDHTSTGVRLTHLPSPWIADYAYLTMMPQTGDAVDFTPECKSGYRPKEVNMKPYELTVDFLRYQVSYHLVPTMRGAMAKAIWQQADVTHRISFHLGKGTASVQIDAENNKIFGTVSSCVWKAIPENFCMYFVIFIVLFYYHASLPSRTRNNIRQAITTIAALTKVTISERVFIIFFSSSLKVFAEDFESPILLRTFEMGL
jgi:putative alpha-1,2-mannosidase